MHITIVILNYNGSALLEQFLPSVVKNSEKADIVVVDNGSTDNSLTLINTHFPSIRTISLEKNFGFCKGYNIALKKISADIYILLNSDVEVTPGWLTPILCCFNRDSSIAAVQPKILSQIHRNQLEYAGAGGGFVDSLGYPFCRGRIFQHVEEDQGQYDDERAVFWASGACLAIRSNVFDEFEGFDEDYFAHMEEIDLCWKILRSGRKVYYTGKSKVFHLGAGTLSYESSQKTFLNFRNNLITLFKHYSVNDLCWKIPVRGMLDLLAMGYYLGQGKYRNSLAILKAHIAFWLTLKTTLKKRKGIYLKTKTFDTQGLIYPGTILFKRPKFAFKTPK